MMAWRIVRRARGGVAAMLATVVSACVQPAYDRTVVYELDVSGVRNLHAVGIRGNDAPLSWEQDVALLPVVKDSLYRVAVTYHTGYLFTEVKFTVDGTFELANGDNRRVTFPRTATGGDTVVYRAVFDRR